MNALLIFLRGHTQTGVMKRHASWWQSWTGLGWITVTHASCVLAEYEGDPTDCAQLSPILRTREIMKPEAAHHHR